MSKRITLSYNNFPCSSCFTEDDFDVGLFYVKDPLNANKSTCLCALLFLYHKEVVKCCQCNEEFGFSFQNNTIEDFVCKQCWESLKKTAVKEYDITLDKFIESESKRKKTKVAEFLNE